MPANYHPATDIAQAGDYRVSGLERRPGDVPPVELSPLLAEIVEGIAFAGRESEYIDQRSGVSARLAIAARELLISQVERRLVLQEGSKPVARLVDLIHLVPAITGR